MLCIERGRCACVRVSTCCLPAWPATVLLAGAHPWPYPLPAPSRQPEMQVRSTMPSVRLLAARQVAGTEVHELCKPQGRLTRNAGEQHLGVLLVNLGVEQGQNLGGGGGGGRGGTAGGGRSGSAGRTGSAERTGVAGVAGTTVHTPGHSQSLTCAWRLARHHLHPSCSTCTSCSVSEVSAPHPHPTPHTPPHLHTHHQTHLLAPHVLKQHGQPDVEGKGGGEDAPPASSLHTRGAQRGARLWSCAP